MEKIIILILLVLVLVISVVMFSILALYRNQKVFRVRTYFLFYKSKDQYNRLPSYSEMMSYRYWHLWTVKRWVKYLGKQTN